MRISDWSSYLCSFDLESATTRILVDTSLDLREQLLAADIIDIDAIFGPMITRIIVMGSMTFVRYSITGASPYRDMPGAKRWRICAVGSAMYLMVGTVIPQQ